MKVLVVILSACLLLVACSRKTVPAKHNNTTTTNPPPVNAASGRAMIVIDGYGRVLTPHSQLPTDSTVHPDYGKLARAFTPEQRTNLMYRFKTVPPRVLYVSGTYVQKSLRGTYCVYKKKFWYWKKADGLFYLDETYYQ